MFVSFSLKPPCLRRGLSGRHLSHLFGVCDRGVLGVLDRCPRCPRWMSSVSSIGVLRTGCDVKQTARFQEELRDLTGPCNTGLWSIWDGRERAAQPLQVVMIFILGPNGFGLESLESLNPKKPIVKQSRWNSQSNRFREGESKPETT